MKESDEIMSEVPIVGEYEYGFQDKAEIIFSTGLGLNEDVIRTISKEKNEPQWMLDYRLKSYKIYKSKPVATWGADLSGIDFDDITYYQKATNQPVRSWDDVPDEIKKTFDRLGIPEAERA